ncbi:MAG: acetyl-CoA acetyltransferase [Rhodospirillaceae bacterium]|nr:acetyl-CoA acetyltransferase [Rhodospirillaceae bacterium]
MPENRVYLLGGYQSDFKKAYQRVGINLKSLMGETVDGALTATDIEPREIDVAHVGNFVAELFCGQGQLGGFFAALHPEFSGLPAARHEGACASGSLAALAAQADLKAGHYDLACVLGVEMMRHTDAQTAANNLAAAAHIGAEGQGAQWMWPWMFDKLGEEYDRRYGLKYEHLSAIGETNFSNARTNPNAQTREYQFNENSFTKNDDANPVVEGMIRKQDCGQITDGAACILLASEVYAKEYAARRGMALENIPYIRGWGHRTVTIRLEDKLKERHNSPYVFPHVRGTLTDAYQRARIAGPEDLDVIETHDCFTTTEYMAIDHFGITGPGESWKAVEDGTIQRDGSLPVNPSGGLIGGGHPVGATGIRMLVDSYKQVTNTADGFQVEGAKTAATLNIGGSSTTMVSFIVSAGSA